MHIDIIGGSGFIGTRLCTRISSVGEHSFSIIDKRASEVFPENVLLADVRSLECLSDAVRLQSVIVNLAAEHRDDVRPRSLYDEVNIGGAVNICRVAREKLVKTIIFTSSVAVYGFAPIGTVEDGVVAPFNDYGRTKYLAEEVFREWQAEAPQERSLVIIRPTVVFGERNRGNVFNLLKQIHSGRFLMIGTGKNRKSIAYVENVAAFIEYSIGLGPGTHVYNYVDKPDFSMNELVSWVRRVLERGDSPGFRIPFSLGYLGGLAFDALAWFSGRSFPISAIRVKKFCANSVYGSAVDKTPFVAPVSLKAALEKTVRHEFIEDHRDGPVFYSE